MILRASDVEIAVPARGKKALIAHLGARFAERLGVSAAAVTACLSERERLGTTGFGGGVAIPHGKLEGLGAITGHFVRLVEPLEFDAVDRLPVDLVFALLSPPDAGAEHLKTLAAVSRALRDDAMRAKLRGARSPDAVYALLAERDIHGPA